MSAKLARASALGFVLRITGAGVSYAFVVVLARIMTTADFGIVGTIMSGSLLFSVIGCAGQRMAVLRFVPPEIEKPDAPPPVSTIARAFRLAIVGNLAVFALLVAAAFTAQAIGRINNGAVIAFGLLIVPLMGTIDMQAHLSRAYRSIALALLPKDVLWRFLSGSILAAIYFATGRHDVPAWLALAVLIGILLSLIVAQGQVMQRLLGVPGFLSTALKRKVEGRDPAWERARLPLWVASITSVAFTNLDVVAAGVLIGPEAAALYFVANRVAQAPSLFLESYNIVIGPLFSGHHAGGREAELRQVARSACLQAFVPTLLAVAVLGIGAKYVLMLFGPHFVAAENVVRILLLAVLVNAAFGPSDLLLTMCGAERSAMMIGIVGTSAGALAIISGALLGSAESVAVGTFTAVLLARLLSWRTVYRRLGFSADALTSVITLLKGRSA